MIEFVDFAVVELNRLIWPADLQLPGRRFRLLLAADSADLSVDEISAFAEAALSRGMVYLCTWGSGCKRFHDIVDEIRDEDDIGRRRFAGPTADDVIMTTSHDDEPLEEALEFFTISAVPSDGFAPDSDYRVVLCLNNAEWAQRARQFLRNAQFF